MRSVTSKSAMTPSLSGPTATIWPVLVLRATTDGSLSTIPRPLTYTRVFAVPRSTAMSRPRKASALLIGNENLPEGSCWVSYIWATDAAHRAVRTRPCVLHRPGPGHLNKVGEEDL